MTSSSNSPSYQTHFEKAPIGIFEVNQNGEYLNVNQAACELVGYSKDELLGMSIGELSPQETEPSDLPSFSELTETGQTRVEFELLHKNGNLIDVIIEAVTIDDGRFVAYVQDNTTQKETERELRELKNQFQTLFEKAPEAIMIHDRDGDILKVNQQAIENLGYSREELTSMNFVDFELTHSRSEIQELWDEMDIGETRREESEHERKDGSTLPVSVWVNKVEMNGNVRFLSFSRDITEWKERGRELAAARETSQKIIEASPTPIWVQLVEEIQYSNDAAATFFGHDDTESLVGTSALSYVPESERDRVRQLNKGMIETGEAMDELRGQIITKNGMKREAVFAAAPITYDGDQAIVTIANDITEQKAYERQLEEQRNNLKILNQVVRHDIRNKLQLVLAYADKLRTDVEGTNQAYTEDILEAAHEAADITTTARDMTKVMLQSEVDLRPIQLRPVLENELESVRSQYNSVLIKSDGPLPAVEVLADNMLESVFRNLLTNAVQHNDKEIPEVSLSATTDDETVVIRITDNGPGIPDEQKQEIFKRKEIDHGSEGTGVGLYLADSLVSRYDGDIRVEDNKSVGASFIVELPIADSE